MRCGWVLLALAMWNFTSATAAANEVPTDPEREAGIRAVLEYDDEGALPVFVAATEALEDGRHDEAVRGFTTVARRQPEFEPARRRLCRALLGKGDRSAGIVSCRAARQLDGSMENFVLLLESLLSPGATEEDFKAAAREGSILFELHMFPSPEALLLVCEAALRGRDIDTLGRCHARLAQTDVPGPEVHVYGLHVALARGHNELASREIDAAEAAGLSPERVAALRKQLDRARPFGSGIGFSVAAILAVWLVLCTLAAAAAVATRVRSRGALRRQPRPASQEPFVPHTGGDRFDAVVLRILGIAFHGTLPLTGLLVVAMGGALVMIMLKGLLIVRTGVFVFIALGLMLGAIVQTMLARTVEREPGTRLSLNEHPELAALLEACAAELGTRPADDVFIVPDARVEVIERGSFREALLGRSTRLLLLGLPVLDSMTQAELRAALLCAFGSVHEGYGGGGAFARSALRSMCETAAHLRLGDSTLAVANPAMWFTVVAAGLFGWVAKDVIAMQRRRADDRAAMAVGSDPLIASLERLHTTHAEFEAQLTGHVERLLHSGDRMDDVYAEMAALDPDEQREEATRDAGTAARHQPELLARTAWLEARAHPPTSNDDDELGAWRLVQPRDRLQRSLTEVIRTWVGQQRGIRIPSTPRQRGRKAYR